MKIFKFLDLKKESRDWQEQNVKSWWGDTLRYSNNLNDQCNVTMYFGINWEKYKEEKIYIGDPKKWEVH